MPESIDGLSTGFLSAIVAGSPVGYPVFVQLQEVKAMPAKAGASGEAQKRLRIYVSDGQHSKALMLSSQAVKEIESRPDAYVPNAVLSLGELLRQHVNGRLVLIVLHMEVAGHANRVFGAPVPLGDGEAAASTAPGALPLALGPQPGIPPSQAPHGPQGPAAGYGAGYGGTGPVKPDPYIKAEPHPQGGYGGPPGAGGAGPGGGYGAGGAPGGGFPKAGGGPGGPPGGGGGGGGGQWGGPQQGPGYGGPPSGGNRGAMGYGGGGMGAGAGGPPGGFGGYGGGAGGGRGGGGGGGTQDQYNMRGGGPTARNEAPARIVPIRSLNPYNSRWAVKARCTSKSDLRRYNSVKGEGKLFNFDLLDRDGGEIRVTAFNEQVDKFFDLVREGGIYMLSKANLNPKKPQFNSTNHEYEVQLQRESILELCTEDAESSAIPMVQYKFRRIEELEACPANTIVDVIGVVENVGAWSTITRKTGEETRKRAVVIRDDSNRSIEITLWGNFVDKPGNDLEQAFKTGAHPIVAAKAVRVGDFNGKTLSTLNSSQVHLEPACPQTPHLRAWWDQGGASAAPVAMSGQGGGGGGGRSNNRTTLQAIKDEGLGTLGKPEWVNVTATINFLRTQSSNQPGVVYPSCPATFSGRSCQKKMSEIQPGEYSCDRCNQTTYQPVWRYMLSLTVLDHTGQQWLSAFGDSADVLFGFPADKYVQMRNEQPEWDERVGQLFNFKHMVFRLKVAEDTWNEETRIKVSIFKMEEVNYAKESAVVLDIIHKLEAGIPALQARPPEGPATQQQQGGLAGPSGFGGQQQQQQQQGGFGGPGGVQHSIVSPVGRGGAGGPGGYQGRPVSYDNGMPPPQQQQQMGGPPQQGYGASGPGMYGGGGGYQGGYGGPPAAMGAPDGSGGGGMYGQQQQGGYGGAPGGWQQQPQQGGGPGYGGGGYGTGGGGPPAGQQQQGGPPGYGGYGGGPGPQQGAMGRPIF